MLAQTINLSSIDSSPNESQHEFTQIAKGVQEYIAGIPAELARIETNKDALDMVPAMNFVQINSAFYKQGLENLTNPSAQKLGIEFARRIKITWYPEGTDFRGQITPKEVKSLLSWMPESLRELSHLRDINYDYKSAGYRIHVPIFHPDGTFARIADAVKPEDFPRQKDITYWVFWWINKDDGWNYEESSKETKISDHPTRLLVGISNGSTIFPSALPISLWTEEDIKSYQTGVFLHEFFHTIDYPNRNIEARSAIKLQAQDGSEFTFQDWWKEWEELLIKEGWSSKISYYAGTYSYLLNSGSKNTNYSEFTSAVAEQICETFVAYMLNIQTNPDGWTDFRDTKSQSAKYGLMDKLCTANVIQKS